MAGVDRCGGFGPSDNTTMSQEVATFSGLLTGMGFNDDSIARVIREHGFDVESFSTSRSSYLSNIHSFTVRVRQECGANRQTISNGIRNVLANVIGFSSVSIRFVVSSGCPQPDLVGGGSIFQPSVYQGGQLATVNVPIPPDDTTVATGGIVDSITSAVKGYDTLTLVLLGLAAVLVVRKL